MISDNSSKKITDFSHVFCVGIGGAGMSGLSQLLKEYGLKVSGSDQNPSQTIDLLLARGLKVTIDHAPENLPLDTDLVIYSPAIPQNNPERLAAAAKDILQLSYPQAIGLLTQQKKTIAVCGTHGKTTTTGMLATAFVDAEKDPTVIVGSSLRELENRSERFGKGEYFIVEACEYYRGFLNYSPQVVVLTNVEADHLDYYKNLEDYVKAFEEFVEKLPKDGFLVANYDDENVRKVASDSKKKVVFFGKDSSAKYRLVGTKIFVGGKLLGDFDLSIPGDHNRLNALATLACSLELGLDFEKVLAAVNRYQGAKRRFEIKGTVGKTTIIDDYGHHPTEIKATLKALREKFGREKKVLCIFQPHQHNRTFHLLEGFAQAFADADEVIIPNIYAARDSQEDKERMNEEKLVSAIGRFHPAVSYGHGLDRTVENVKKRLQYFDVVITMGAGDVTKVAECLTI